MTGTIKPADPDSLEICLTCQMSLREWRYVRDSLQRSPSLGSLEFRRLIEQLIQKIENNFTVTLFP